MPSRILVITSDETIRRGFDPLLRQHDMVTLCASTLAGAQEITLASDIDAVILQAGFSGSLPGLHYVQWLRSRSKYRATPVAVVIREHELHEHEVAAAEALGTRVFSYPKETAAILDHVDAAIAERHAA